MLKWDTAWRGLRDAAGLPGLRFHDLRHTVMTEARGDGASWLWRDGSLQTEDSVTRPSA